MGIGAFRRHARRYIGFAGKHPERRRGKHRWRRRATCGQQFIGMTRDKPGIDAARDKLRMP